MRALVTNDDGVASEGIRVLACAAVRAGLDVLVAAPGWDSSGASASLTSVAKDGNALTARRRLDGLDGVEVFAVEAAPAFIVRAAMTGTFGTPPDIVLSGVNHGRNTGHLVLHSGTVGAALTAATSKRRAMAISIDAARPRHWDTAEEVAVRAIRWLLDAEAGVALNVNVPDVTLGELGGMERATLASFGAVQTNLSEVGKGYRRYEYQDRQAVFEEGSDAALLAAGRATFTPLLPVCEATAVDTASLR